MSQTKMNREDISTFNGVAQQSCGDAGGCLDHLQTS